VGGGVSGDLLTPGGRLVILPRDGSEGDSDEVSRFLKETQGLCMGTGDFTDRTITTTQLVKSEDLNHHRTLYAGRCVEWSVQMAYIAAENCFDEARSVVFMSIRSLSMRTPAQLGEIIQFTGRVDYIGESTIGIRVDGKKLQPKGEQKTVVTGTFLFCTVDEDGKAAPHGLPALAPGSDAARGRWKDVDDAFPTSR
jgi:acyl-CoA hydrolase